MKEGGGKTKGNAFENLIAKKLSRWLAPGDATQLIPSRLSGGWKEASWRHAGDLAPNGPEGEKFRLRFMVECKHNRKDLLWLLFTADAPGRNLQGWWEKLRKEAEVLSLLPMLVFRQNRRPILVALPQWLAREMHKAVGGTLLEYSSRGEDGHIAWGCITLEALTSSDPLELPHYIRLAASYKEVQ